MSKVLFGVFAILLLLVAAALIGPNLINWNSYKSEIVAQAENVTGRSFTIDGDIDFSVVPGLRLTAANVKVANIRGGSAPEMVELKSLDVHVRLLPLLSGKVEVDAITLLEPVILLERLSDGRKNWEFDTEKKMDPSSAISAHEGPLTTIGLGQEVQLGKLHIRRGTVIYRDALNGTKERVAGISMRIGVESLTGPYRASGDVIFRGVPIKLDAVIDKLKPTGLLPMWVNVRVPPADAKLTLRGGAVLAGDVPRFTGKLDISGKDMRRLIAVAKGGSRTTISSALAQPFSLKAIIKGTEKGGAIENLAVELGGTQVTGAISFAMQKRFRTAARIRISRLDLDAWTGRNKLPLSAKPASKTENVVVEDKKNSSAFTNSERRTQKKPMFVLPNMYATVEAHIDAVTYNRQNARNVQIKAALAGGVLTLNQASLLLPGGGEASVSGRIFAQGGRPVYSGKLDAHADNLRALLGWLGKDVGPVPASRLRKFAFSSSIKGTHQRLKVQDAKVSIDTTRIDGDITLALRERLAFGATVNVDSLDLDAYAPPRRQPKSKKNVQTGKDAVKRLGTKYSIKSAPTASQKPLAPLAFLNHFDANVRLRVGRLKANQIPIRELRLESSLIGGVMNIKRASIKNIEGISAGIAGRLSNFKGIPTFNGSVSADAHDTSGLLKLIGIAPNNAIRKLGALKLRGKTDANSDRVKLNITLAATGANIRLKGTAANLEKAPNIDLKLIADHRNLTHFIRMFGKEVSAKNLGQLRFDAHVKGNLKRLSTSLYISAIGGKLHSHGVVTNVKTDPVFDMVVSAHHPVGGAMVRMFAPEFRIEKGKIGPLNIKTTVKGKLAKYTLSALTASAGNIAFQGTGRLSTSGPRPSLTAVLNAQEIDLNFFMPGTHNKTTGNHWIKGKTGQNLRARARRDQVRKLQRSRRLSSGNPGQMFSKEPFKLDGLGLIDAKLSLIAKSLIYKQFRIDRPKIKATLIDRILTIRDFSGRMFGGSFKSAGTFNGQRTLSLDGKVNVAKAEVVRALFPATHLDIQGGVTDLSIKLVGSGKTPYELINSLNGAGSVKTKNGSIKGFDLKAVSDRLKKLDGPEDMLSLVGTTMKKGRTKFSALSATFRIKNGVLKTDDLHLVAEAGEAHASGIVNWPLWHMDFNSRFVLTDHPKAPPFSVHTVGAIDNPKRIFKFDQLQAHILDLIRVHSIKILMRKAFSGSRRQFVPKKQNQRPIRKRRVEDLLPQIWEKLSR